MPFGTPKMNTENTVNQAQKTIHTQSHLYVKPKNTKNRGRVAKWLGMWEMEQDKEVSVIEH